MTVELSALFGMDYASDMVKDTHIGDGVFLQEIKLNDKVDELFQKVKDTDEKNYRNLVAREDLEVSGRPYTHRFYVSLDDEDSFESRKIKDARQFIMRAIVLSRIIRPLPIPLHPTTILTVNNDSYAEIDVGFYGTAYVVRRLPKETITVEYADLMAKYWPASQYFYHNKKHFKSMHRALMTFNDAYHIGVSHLSHVVLHAALETLVCTTHRNNKNQVVHRLPQLIDRITVDQVTEIYHFCADVKHSAAPRLLYSKSIREMDTRDTKRYEAAKWLEESLRKLFVKALEDRIFAEELEDKKTLEAKYPVPK